MSNGHTQLSNLNFCYSVLELKKTTELFYSAEDPSGKRYGLAVLWDKKSDKPIDLEFFVWDINGEILKTYDDIRGIKCKMGDGVKITEAAFWTLQDRFGVEYIMSACRKDAGVVMQFGLSDPENNVRQVWDKYITR